MCPQETCGSEWAQGCLGRDQERRGTLAVPEEFGGAITLIPREHRHAVNSGESDPPRPKRAPIPATAHPCHPRPRTPGSMLPLGQCRAPSPPLGTSRNARGTVGRIVDSVPADSGAPRPGPAPPATDAQDLADPAPPHPRGLPDASPDPSRPTPDPFAPKAQSRSESREHAALPRKSAGVKICALSAAGETWIRHKAGQLERNLRVRTVPGKRVRTRGERHVVASALCRRIGDSAEGLEVSFAALLSLSVLNC